MEDPAQHDGTITPWQGPAPSPARKRPDASFWLTALAGAPQALSSLAILSTIGSTISPWAAWIVPLIWVALSGLIFLPSVESLLAQLMFQIRRPSPVERARLHPQWLSVARAANLDPNRYSLWVEDSHDCNAAAAGGRTVIVTREALELPDQQLAAVLAHEVGHHRSGHPVALILTSWYEIPTRLATVVIRWSIRVVMVLGHAFARLSNGISILIAMGAALALLIMLFAVNPWLLVAPVIAAAAAAARRTGEFAADRAAVEFGYGPDLLLVLRYFMAGAHQGPPATLRARLLSSHPPLGARVARLESLLWTS